MSFVRGHPHAGLTLDTSALAEASASTTDQPASLTDELLYLAGELL